MNSGRSIAVPKQLGAVEKLANGNGKWQKKKLPRIKRMDADFLYLFF